MIDVQVACVGSTAAPRMSLRVVFMCNGIVNRNLPCAACVQVIQDEDDLAPVGVKLGYTPPSRPSEPARM